MGRLLLVIGQRCIFMSGLTIISRYSVLIVNHLGGPSLSSFPDDLGEEQWIEGKATRLGKREEEPSWIF